MKAKEEAKQKTKDKIQEAMAKPVVAGSVGDAEKPAIPVANVNPNDDTEEIPIAGRTKMTVPKKNPQEALSSEQDSGAGSGSGSNAVADKKVDEEEESKLDAKAELNSILKRAPSMLDFCLASSCLVHPGRYWDPLLTLFFPVIIFSKSYCPFSKKAKAILLEGYTISPKPFVVELDQHPIGPELQALLAENTGRRTVPNVLVNGKSIGGGDDIAALDQSDDLASKLRQLGGKWVSDVSRGPPKEHF